MLRHARPLIPCPREGGVLATEVSVSVHYEVMLPASSQVDDITHRLTADEARSLCAQLLWELGGAAREVVDEWEIAIENEE